MEAGPEIVGYETIEIAKIRGKGYRVDCSEEAAPDQCACRFKPILLFARRSVETDAVSDKPVEEVKDGDGHGHRDNEIVRQMGEHKPEEEKSEIPQVSFGTAWPLTLYESDADATQQQHRYHYRYPEEHLGDKVHQNTGKQRQETKYGKPALP